MPTTGMNDERAVHLRGGALGQFLVDAVQGIARLEGDDVIMSHFFEHWRAPAQGCGAGSTKS
jgi:hypothetical protein